MGKAFIITCCYLSALFLIWAGFEIAPDMTWPKTDREIIAAHFLVIGMSLKLLGHSILLLKVRT